MIPHLAWCQDKRTLQCAPHENPHPSWNQLKIQRYQQFHTFSVSHNVPVYNNPIQIPSIYPAESLWQLQQRCIFITFTDGNRPKLPAKLYYINMQSKCICTGEKCLKSNLLRMKPCLLRRIFSPELQ